MQFLEFDAAVYWSVGPAWKGIWRLATSSLLHANIGSLMVNCYSLNSVGPTMENLSGPRRSLAVYFTSALSSAIFGLAIFGLRYDQRCPRRSAAHGTSYVASWRSSSVLAYRTCME
ncbi:hypothetical protein GOBAR_DD30767 [Gossypium barbadense]|nr:hypothetical protein GOBAR_DD30767 [Gossypium barbadense]